MHRLFCPFRFFGFAVGACCSSSRPDPQLPAAPLFLGSVSAGVSLLSRYQPLCFLWMFPVSKRYSTSLPLPLVFPPTPDLRRPQGYVAPSSCLWLQHVSPLV